MLNEGFVFDFEKLEVYQMALDFFDRIIIISKKFPRDIQFSLGDQIRRAALSISNNIAEGSGKRSKREKNYFYNVSFNSTRECVSMINVLERQKIFEFAVKRELRNICIRICCMLVKLIHSLKLT